MSAGSTTQIAEAVDILPRSLLVAARKPFAFTRTFFKPSIVEKLVLIMRVFYVETLGKSCNVLHTVDNIRTVNNTKQQTLIKTSDTEK